MLGEMGTGLRLWGRSGSIKERGGLYFFPDDVAGFYYPPEVSSMKYCYLGVFWKKYFRLITN